MWENCYYKTQYIKHLITAFEIRHLQQYTFVGLEIMKVLYQKNLGNNFYRFCTVFWCVHAVFPPIPFFGWLFFHSFVVFYLLHVWEYNKQQWVLKNKGCSPCMCLFLTSRHNVTFHNFTHQCIGRVQIGNNHVKTLKKKW